jgi:hypothetical protein
MTEEGLYFTSGPAPYNRTLAGGRCTCVEVQTAATHFCMLLCWQFVANFTTIFCHASYCRCGNCTMWSIPDSRAVRWLGVWHNLLCQSKTTCALGRGVVCCCVHYCKHAVRLLCGFLVCLLCRLPWPAAVKLRLRGCPSLCCNPA